MRACRRVFSRLEIDLRIQRRRGGLGFLLLQLEGAGPLLDLPFVAQRNAPGDVFQGQIEFRREQFQIQHAGSRRAGPAFVENFHAHRLVADAIAAPAG